MSASAAIYARYSTALQNEKSVEDQISLCRAFAQREGYHVVAAYDDKALSGGSMHGREGLRQMLTAAEQGQFSVIIVEALDRLSRDMEDLAHMYKRLSFMGVRLVAVHEGEANTILVGLRGLIGQMYREDNVHKIKRGMAGLLKQGLTAGGQAYGYRADPANRGKPLIVEEEAQIVRRIFEDYAKGISPKAICHRLNAERVPAPRGKQWSPSALIGFESRGTGTLRNPIYVGRIVWGKVTMVKDPDTGKRLSRPVPRDQWQTAEIPELRIMPDELFEAVQKQLNGRRHVNRRENIGVHKRPKRLLSGLLKCGACGSGMSVAGVDKSGRTRLRCSAHTNSGNCPDPKTYYLDEVEALVIESLTKELATADQIKRYAEVYQKERRKQAIQENRRRIEIEVRLKAIEKENMRLVELMLLDGADTATLGAKTKVNGAERDQLQLELASLPEGTTVTVHRAAIENFARKLSTARAKLEMTLAMLEDMGELSGLIREIIESITLSKEGKAITVEVRSWLDPFLSDEGKPRIIKGAGPLVAEEGLEPPTRGL
ncbi:recombinase family protein [Pelagibacterium mangrovi]|uniref:recombinase family protein n=1 Tax=Pelagibacterium mangrovi TaxID=3119828 RepID=UPI003F7FB461